jgi:hypothetical protein
MSTKSTLAALALTAALAAPMLSMAQYEAVYGEIQGNTVNQTSTQPVSVDLSGSDSVVDLESHVNLATGGFHDYDGIYKDSDTYGRLAIYDSDMTDYLILQGPGTTAVPVTLAFRVDGIYTYDQTLTLQQQETLITNRFLKFGTGESGFKTELDRENQGTLEETFTTTPTGTVIQTTVNKNFTDVTIEVTQMMTPGQSLQFESNVNGETDSGFGPACAQDYMNTGQMGVILPNGYSFTSYSGVFLTAAPEPAPLVALGLGVLAILIRRREPT